MGPRLDHAGNALFGSSHAEKTLELAPRNATAHVMLAEHLTARDRLDQAMEHLRKAVEIDPSLPEPRIALARACVKRGRLERARDHLRELVAAHPKHPGVLELKKELEKRRER